MTKRKRPNDPLEMAKMIGDIATGQIVDDDGKDPSAVARGSIGGTKGGKARAESLSSDRRKEISMKAIKARWHRE